MALVFVVGTALTAFAVYLLQTGPTRGRRSRRPLRSGRTLSMSSSKR